jgi:hypothetical protein
VSEAIGAHVAWQVVNGEVVVVDLPAGRVLGLNPVASLVWSLFGDHDEAEIAAEVCRRFDVDIDTARRDVSEFVALLRHRGLLAQ